MTHQCPFQTLGVSQNASFLQIKFKYKQLSDLYHPDKHPGNEGLYSQIQVAYLYLSDLSTRKYFKKKNGENLTSDELTKAWRKAKQEYKKNVKAALEKTREEDEIAQKKLEQEREEQEETNRVNNVFEDIRQADTEIDIANQSAHGVKEQVYIWLSELSEIFLNIKVAEERIKNIRLKQDPNTLEILWPWSLTCQVKEAKSLLSSSYQDVRKIQQGTFDELVSNAQIPLEVANSQIDSCLKGLRSLKNKNNKGMRLLDSVISKRSVFYDHIIEAKRLRKLTESVCTKLKNEIDRIEKKIREIKEYGMTVEEKVLESVQNAFFKCVKELAKFTEVKDGEFVQASNQNVVIRFKKHLNTVVREKEKMSQTFINLLAAEEEKAKICNNMQHEMRNIMNGVKYHIAAGVEIETKSTGDYSAQEAASVGTFAAGMDKEPSSYGAAGKVKGDSGVDVTAGCAMDIEVTADEAECVGTAEKSDGAAVAENTASVTALEITAGIATTDVTAGIATTDVAAGVATAVVAAGVAAAEEVVMITSVEETAGVAAAEEVVMVTSVGEAAGVAAAEEVTMITSVEETAGVAAAEEVTMITSVEETAGVAAAEEVVMVTSIEEAAGVAAAYVAEVVARSTKEKTHASPAVRNSKRVTCLICGKKFRNRKKIDRHQRKHAAAAAENTSANHKTASVEFATEEEDEDSSLGGNQMGNIGSESVLTVGDSEIHTEIAARVRKVGVNGADGVPSSVELETGERNWEQHAADANDLENAGIIEEPRTRAVDLQTSSVEVPGNQSMEMGTQIMKKSNEPTTSSEMTSNPDSGLRRCDRRKPASRAGKDNGKKHKCETCGLFFSASSNLARHKKVHSKDRRKYECTNCEYFSFYKENLDRHMKSCNKTL